MISVYRRFIYLPLLLVVTGCCSNITTDPRQGGLQGGICGTATGSYDRRIAALEAQRDSLSSANARLSASLKNNNRQVAKLDGEIRRKRAQLSKLKSGLKSLLDLKKQDAALRKEIRVVLAETEQRERAVIAMEEGVRRAQNNQVREEAVRRAEGIGIDDLLKKFEDLRAKIEK